MICSLIIHDITSSQTIFQSSLFHQDIQSKNEQHCTGESISHRLSFVKEAFITQHVKKKEK